MLKEVLQGKPSCSSIAGDIRHIAENGNAAKKKGKKDMNTEVIPKAAYSNGLQETGQDGVVFTMPASREKTYVSRHKA